MRHEWVLTGQEIDKTLDLCYIRVAGLHRECKPAVFFDPPNFRPRTMTHRVMLVGLYQMHVVYCTSGCHPSQLVGCTYVHTVHALCVSVEPLFMYRFYMTSKMSNPHYLPEVCIKVTIINFTVTRSGLEDQLLRLAASYKSCFVYVQYCVCVCVCPVLRACVPCSSVVCTYVCKVYLHFVVNL